MSRQSEFHPQNRGRAGQGIRGVGQILANPEANIKERVFPVAQTIAGAANPIIDAMASTPFPREIATDIVTGEQGRILGLGRAFWPFFYGSPLELLSKAGHPVKKLFEIGPSLEAHLGALDPSLQPKRSEATDFPHIAKGATVSIQALKRANMLRPDAEYRVRAKERRFYHADLSVSILEAQYDNWKTLARKLFNHSDTALVGDVLHGLTEISALQHGVEKGRTITFSTSTFPGRSTGFRMDMLEEVGSYGKQDSNQQYTRKYFKYRLVPDSLVIGSNPSFTYLDSGANQVGVCTVFVDKAGKEYVQAWTYRPKEGASAEDMRKVFAAEETLHDLYAHTPEWDGNGAMGVLHELSREASGRRRHVNTLVTTKVPDGNEMSGRLPLTILARNKQQLVERAEKGELRHVGPGKAYETVDDLLHMIQNDLLHVSESGKARIDEIATFDPPPLLDIIASKNSRVIHDILALADKPN